MEDLVKRQRQFFLQHQTKTYEFRRLQLDRLENAVLKHQLALSQALRADLGKPDVEAYGMEIDPLLKEIRLAKKHLLKWMSPQNVSTPFFLTPAKSRIYREPLGVVLIIAPWNYPLYLTLSPLVGAIAAGNCAVIKPSELSLNTTRVLALLIRDTFATEYVTLIEGGVNEARELLKLKFDHIFFTGSTHVGKSVLKAAAETLTPVTLELGGKSPVFVCESAKIDQAARKIAWGKFLNAGQSCIAPDYLYVHEKIAPEFTSKVLACIQSFYGDEPRKSESFGRIINERHFTRLTSLIANGKTLTPWANDRASRFFAPTVLNDVSWDDPVMKEEVFGPILPILTFSDLSSAFNEVRNQEKPLSAYLFSENKSEHQLFTETLSFGGGCINDTVIHTGNPYLPFGGVGASGIGAYHGEFSFHTFSHAKSVIAKGQFLDLAVRYPPYTEKNLRWLRRFLRM